jgi:hypothetical protein
LRHAFTSADLRRFNVIGARSTRRQRTTRRLTTGRLHAPPEQIQR